jgi:hypothetical protein
LRKRKRTLEKEKDRGEADLRIGTKGRTDKMTNYNRVGVLA